MDEIIIDDIDVSGCCHNNSRDNEGVCDIYKRKCYHIFCNYKQLKRKEKECEELKRWRDDVANKFMRTCNCKYLDNKRTYCEYYKAECVAINQCLYANQDKVEKLKQECEELKKEHDMLEKAIANILPTYQECIVTAEDDMLCGILDRHASEAEFCVHVIHETRSKIKNLFNENIKLKQALQEIKRIITEPIKTYWEYRKEILDKINEVEE